MAACCEEVERICFERDLAGSGGGGESSEGGGERRRRVGGLDFG
jgi:hypothetical protein